MLHLQILPLSILDKLYLTNNDNYLLNMKFKKQEREKLRK